MVGIYTDYYDEYPNGDRAQTISVFLECYVTGGELIKSNDETLALRFYSFDNFPELVNKQHTDVFEDLKNNRYGVLR